MVIQEVSFRREVVTFTAQSRSTAPAPARQCTDSVSLSPEATAGTNAGLTAGTKAENLVTALDSDKDGAVSDQEFVDGGTALLRRAYGRYSHGDLSETGVHREGRHGSHRLEHRLERIFETVDANGDGALDAGELTAALTGAAATPAPQPEETATETSGDTPTEAQSPASSNTTVAFQFTFVSIAVRQYQASGQEPTPSQPQLQASA